MGSGVSSPVEARTRPDVSSLVALAVALALLSVATFLEGKRLWAAYNAVGVALALSAALLVRRLGTPLPRGAALLCVLTALLHYVGGSLGGHFGIDGINGLYAVIPWYDRVTHFFGAAGVALLAQRLLAAQAARDGWRVPSATLGFFAFCLTLAVGVGVELFEFGAWSFFGTVDQGFYSNTMMDLYDDATGALFGAALAVAWPGPSARRRPKLDGASPD